MEKTLEAEDVGLLKHLLSMELRRMVKRAEMDMAFFMGVDGRIFTSFIPEQLEKGQFALLSLFQQNMPHICGQLQQQNMKLSLQYYPEGLIIISGVGSSAFLAGLISTTVATEKVVASDEMAMKHFFGDVERKVRAIEQSSMVIRHIFDLKPLSEDTLEGYPEEVSEELRKLGRLLFKERFTQTREYRKNAEILEYIKRKLETVLSRGQVEEVVTLTFNELGTTVGFMDRNLWTIFLEKVITNHVRRITGEIVADECRRTWVPEVENKIRSFV